MDESSISALPFDVFGKPRKLPVDWAKLADAWRGLYPAEIDHLNHAWHRLDPWPDAVPGLTRLKRRFTLATLSNGNIARTVDMAKRAGLQLTEKLGG